MATDDKGYTLTVGLEFRRWNTSTGSWDKFGKVLNVSPTGKSREGIEVTDYDDTGLYIRRKPGFRDPGSFTITIAYTKDTYDKLNSDYENDDLVPYEFVAPDDDNQSWEFEGFISQLPYPFQGPKGIMQMDVEITLSGKPEVESGSGPSGGSGGSLLA